MKAPLKRSRSTADGADEDSQEQLQEQLLESGGPEEEQRTDNTSLLRLLEEGEKVREGCTNLRPHLNYVTVTMFPTLFYNCSRLKSAFRVRYGACNYFTLCGGQNVFSKRPLIKFLCGLFDDHTALRD